MKRTTCLLASISMHLLVLLALILPSCSTVKPPPPKDDKRLTVVRLLPYQEPKTTDTTVAKNGRTWTGDDCPDKTKVYEGIGIVYGFLTDRVLEAPPSLPAYKAGVRVNDIIVSSVPGGTNGIPDGWTEYEFYRGQKHYTVRIKLEKICFEAAKPPQATGMVPHQ